MKTREDGGSGGLGVGGGRRARIDETSEGSHRDGGRWMKREVEGAGNEAAVTIQTVPIIILLL